MSGQPSEQIKDRLDIVDVVSEYIKLQRAGSNFKAICPFHNENTPSFFVSPEKQIFNCFGCGKGGDIFRFVMEMEGVEFVDALRILAKKAGVELKRQNENEVSENSVLQEICKDAARYFFSCLQKEAGKEARKYLKERGLKEETIEEFKIGYADSSWDGLYNFLTLKGYKPQMIQKAGLVVFSKNKYFDRFRDRIMFPISDASGYIVGFTGRYLHKKENEGKYINTPATPIFDKSKVIYNLDKAKMEIKKAGFSVLMEGQMDVILSWQEGVKNAVASSGTALTPKQAKLLKRYAQKVKMIFDSDDAGQEAAKRGAEIAQREGLSVSIVKIPEGKDPADFAVLKKGELKKIIQQSDISLMDFYFSTALEKFNPKDLSGKKSISSQILPAIKSINNKVEAYHWLLKLADVLEVDVKYLEEELKKIKDQNFYSYEKNTQQIQPIQKSQKRDDKLFKSYLAFLAKDPSVFDFIEDSGFLEFFDTNKEYLNEIISQDLILLFDFFQKYVKICQASEMLKKAGPEIKDLLGSVLLQSEFIDDSIDVKKEIEFCQNKIFSDVKNIKIKQLNKKIKEAEKSNDHDLILKYLQELNSLIKSNI